MPKTQLIQRNTDQQMSESKFQVTLTSVRHYRYNHRHGFT